jgi:HK97 family phage major capsid protein
LAWAIEKEIEAQILAGSGVGEDLLGLLTVAQTFDYGLVDMVEGFDRFGIAGAAAAQVRIAGFNPSFIVLHPADAYKMRFTRTTAGEYVNPPAIPPVVETAAMTQGFFLCGDASQAVLRVRQDLTLDLSESHEDFFARNLLALRCEARLAMQVLSRQAFVTGAFGSSPAAA